MCDTSATSNSSIKILTYRIRGSWVYLPYLFINCVTRSCDLLNWIHSNMYRIDVTTRHWNSSMTWQRDKRFKNVFVVENIIILSLIFILDCSYIMAIKDIYWFFCFASIHTGFLLTGIQLLVFFFFCSSLPVVLFDTPWLSRCRSQHVSVKLHADQTTKFWAMREAEGEVGFP